MPYVGSNPTPTMAGGQASSDREGEVIARAGTGCAGVAQLVEHQPSKLRVAGSSPVARSGTQRVARVAQLVEHILGKDEVTGSIPVASLKAAGRAGRRSKKTLPTA
jgi:hypothetical protein